MDALSAVLPINLANAAAVLAVVLGLRTVEMLVTQLLTIHGLKVLKPVDILRVMFLLKYHNKINSVTWTSL